MNDKASAAGADRASSAEYAIAPVRAEGLEPGPDTEADLAAYVRGEVGIDEVVTRALRLAHARHAPES